MRYGRLILFSAFIFLLACNDDEDVIVGLTGNQEDFALFSMDEQQIEGTAFFREREDGATEISLVLKNTVAGNEYPANIHFNSASEGGDIFISLSPVDGDDGVSKTIIHETDAGDPVLYQELVGFNGYINVQQSSSEPENIVAQGDIGPNELTGEAEFYPVFHEADDEYSILSFKERTDGSTWVEFNYTGAGPEGKSAFIQTGTADMTDGEVVISLGELDVNGRVNVNIDQLDDGSEVTYGDLISYDGSVIILDTDNETVVAKGDIGVNKFTGESREYTIDEANGSGVNGVVTFYERADETFMAVVELGGDINTSHPVTINEGDISSDGNIILTLNDATNGLSITEVDQMTFSDIISLNGHINVHLSDDAMGTYIARGNL